MNDQEFIAAMNVGIFQTVRPKITAVSAKSSYTCAKCAETIPEQSCAGGGAVQSICDECAIESRIG